MPMAAPHPCAKPHCPQLCARGQRYCPEHETAAHRADAARRGNFRERGYSSKWDRFRLQFLKANPLCVMCKKDGRIAPARVCDHVVPHRGDPKKFWNPDGGFQALCISCHSKKTAKEDGGFGNPVKR
jgi:5-methylcytosine-specific restriction enzyme A